MPVTIRLLDLVKFTEGRHLWPEEFNAFVRNIEETPEEKTVLGPMADWLKENGEESLERACRYMAKHEQTRFEKSNYGSYSYWHVRGTGYAIASQESKAIIDIETRNPAGALAQLAERIDQARKELE